MDLGSRWVDGKEMKRGYTTGSCAAAAAQAAVYLLFTGQTPKQVTIDTPRGINLGLEVADSLRNEAAAACCVVKNAGDDPDITDGVRVWASARVLTGGVVIKGGQGVGTVTKPGLAVAVGEPAINPVPRRMIEHEIAKVLPPGQGVEVTISIPGGAELAKKTFNRRLGIEGGLSVLGTTGIVEPMSEEAWQESLRLELSILVHQGNSRVVLVPGNYGEDFAKNHLGLTGAPLVKMSNFVGYALKAAVHQGFKEILLVGDLGKLVKVAAGIFQTHSRTADARLEIMAAYGAWLGADRETVKKIFTLNTTGAVLACLEENGVFGLPELVAKRVSERACQYVEGEALIGAVIFNNERGLLAMDDMGREMIARFCHE